MDNKLQLGPYSSIARPPEAFFIVDEYNMVVTMDDYGRIRERADSLGTNFSTFFAYNQGNHVLASSTLWYRKLGKMVGQRHPLISPEEHPMSRDHYTTTLLSLKLHSIRAYKFPSFTLESIVEETGYKISEMARRTLSLKLWSYAILGEKRAELLYYILNILTVALVYLPVHKLGSWIAGYKDEVDQEDYDIHTRVILQELPKYKQVIDKIIYPSYSLLITGYQLYVLKNYPLLRRTLKWLLLQMVGKTNYVQQMLFGKKGIPRDKIESFKAMKGGRWSGYLSDRNDRNMQVLDPQPKFNNIDMDVARRLFNETQL